MKVDYTSEVSLQNHLCIVVVLAVELKVLKERITVLFTVSAVGEKMKLLVIGKSHNHRSFKNHQKEHLPVIYKANSKGWMTSTILFSISTH